MELSVCAHWNFRFTSYETESHARHRTLYHQKLSIVPVNKKAGLLYGHCACPKFMRARWTVYALRTVWIVFLPQSTLLLRRLSFHLRAADNGGKTAPRAHAASSKRDAAGVMHCLILASHPAGQGICLELKIRASNLIKACARRGDSTFLISAPVRFLIVSVCGAIEWMCITFIFMGCDVWCRAGWW